MISQKLQDFEEELKPVGEVMTQATIEMYHEIVARFLPTPTKIHYLFNLRDISRVSHLQCESQSLPLPPLGFLTFCPKQLEIFNQFLHTCLCQITNFQSVFSNCDKVIPY